MSLRWLVLAFHVFVVGCTTTPEVNDAAAPVDASDEVTDAAKHYPAFTPGTPTMHNYGGYVMKAPEITTVTWAGEPNADTFEAFGDQVGASAYWHAVASEYGIGPATSGAGHHIRLTETMPSDSSIDGLRKFVTAHITRLGTSMWPAPQVDSVYMLYLPVCPAASSYHDTVNIGFDVPFAVIGQCPVPTFSMRDSMTIVASHEIGEAANDPHRQTVPSYVGFDLPFVAWDLWEMYFTESADACQFLSAAIFNGAPDFPFWIQRQYSNAAAEAGMDPCVPAQSTYFNVVALDLEDVTQNVTVLGKNANIKTKGFNVAVGTSKDITIGFFSTAPTPDWSVSVVVGNPVLSFLQEPSIDANFIGPTVGNDGATALLRVSVTASGVQMKNGHLLTIESRRGRVVNYYPLLITD